MTTAGDIVIALNPKIEDLARIYGGGIDGLAAALRDLFPECPDFPFDHPLYGPRIDRDAE